MSTKFRFEQGPMVSAATLTSDDGGSAFVFCAIPGGTPQFQFDRNAREASAVVDAPTMETHRQFVAFVRERFGGES